MSKKKMTIRSVIIDCLYFVANILLSIIFETPLPFWVIVIESAIATVLFEIFMRWLISTNKNSQKITANNKSFLKYFSIGMLGGWIILTIMLFFQVGNQMNKVIAENITLIICIYVVVGIVCGLAMYLAFRKAVKN